MTFIANQRIKKGGKFYSPGEQIDLTKEELTDLPPGAVTKDGGAKEPAKTTGLASTERAAQVTAAVKELPEEAFKKDGGIRKDALAGLIEQLGFEVTADEIAAAEAEPDNSEGEA